MLLADVVRCSNQVSGTSSRNAKVSLIADLLRQCALLVADGVAPADEIGLATRYLSGSLRQRRTGIELSSFSERSSWSDLPAPPDAGVVTLSELDTVMKHASEMAGAGSSRLRADLFLDLVRRLTAEERMLVLGLLRGGLRQGALESVVMLQCTRPVVSRLSTYAAPWPPRGISRVSRRPFWWTVRPVWSRCDCCRRHPAGGRPRGVSGG